MGSATTISEASCWLLHLWIWEIPCENTGNEYRKVQTNSHYLVWPWERSKLI